MECGGQEALVCENPIVKRKGQDLTAKGVFASVSRQLGFNASGSFLLL